jgi:hypothetical protein
MQHFVNIILYRLSGDKFCILYRLSEFYIDSHTDILLRHIYVDSPEKKRGGWLSRARSQYQAQRSTDLDFA